MIQIVDKRAKAIIESPTFWSLVYAMDEKGYIAATLSSKKAVLNAAGFGFSGDHLDNYAAEYRQYSPWAYGEEGIGEVFFTSDRCVFLLELELREREAEQEEEEEVVLIGWGEGGAKGRLHAFCIFDTESVTEVVFDKFVADVDAAFEQLAAGRDEKVSLGWQAFRHISPAFRRMAEGKKPLKLDEAELNGTKLLEGRDARALIWALKRVGSLRLSEIEAARVGKKEGVKEQLVDQLEKAGLLRREYLVICTRTGNAVNRADSKEKLERFAKQGLRCSCGRLISEEIIEEAVAPTELGRRLTDHSYWMTVATLEILERLGVPLEEIIVDYTEEGDEIDVFMNLCGLAAIVELKDKEFSLNNSYSFNAKFLRYRADTGMIVTTEVVSPDAKKMLDDTLSGQRAARRLSRRGGTIQPVIYVEGIGKLDAKLSEMVESARVRLATSQFRKLGPIGGLDTATLALSKVTKRNA